MLRKNYRLVFVALIKYKCSRSRTTVTYWLRSCRPTVIAKLPQISNTAPNNILNCTNYIVMYTARLKLCYMPLHGTKRTLFSLFHFSRPFSPRFRSLPRVFFVTALDFMHNILQLFIAHRDVLLFCHSCRLHWDRFCD